MIIFAIIELPALLPESMRDGTGDSPRIVESYTDGAYAARRAMRLNEWFTRQGLPVPYSLASSRVMDAA